MLTPRGMTSTGFIRAVGVILCAGSIVSVVANCPLIREPRNWGLDDAGMYVRYALHILGGHGITWNIGDAPVYGVTSLLYLALLLLPLSLEQWPLRTVIVGTSWFFGLTAVVLQIALVRQMLRDRFPHGWVLLVGLVISSWLIAPVFLTLSLNGIETTLAITLVTLLVMVTEWWIKAPSRSRCAILGVVALATFNTRPDSLFIVTLFPLLRILTSRECVATWKQASLVFMAIVAVLISLDALAKTLVFGGPFPLAHYVKSSGFYDGYVGYQLWNPATLLGRMLHVGSVSLIGILILWRRNTLSLLLPGLIPGALSVGYFFSVVQIMGFDGRFYAPLLPLLTWGLGVLLPLSDIRTMSAAWVIRRGVGLLVCVGLSLVFLRELESRFDSALAARSTRHPVAVSQFPPLPPEFRDDEVFDEFFARLPAGASVALTEHGVIGAKFPEVPIVDLTGLHDPTLAKGQRSIEDVIESRPDVVIMPHPDYTGMIAAIERSSVFLQEYEYFPGFLGFGFALRTTASHYQVIRESLGRACEDTYASAERSIRHACPMPSSR